ncbi:MAG: TonB-dependent receptor [Verrucomicrobiota bacterium]|nr:TonB-dependent receptor [Verrucomicrobiota bacterium]
MSIPHARCTKQSRSLGLLLAAIALGVAPLIYAQETSAIPSADSTLTPAQDTGTVTGMIVDADSGAPLIGVTVKESMGKSVVSDMRGNYVLNDIPVGGNTLNFEKEGYRPSTVTDVAVEKGKLARVDFQLPKAEEDAPLIELEAFVVTASFLTDSDAGMMSIRSQSDAIGDGMSNQMMSRLAISDAADAVTRIPGISISEGKFAVIRGLNDRYSNTQINGMVQPSSDPDRQSVQLDLFPARLLDTVVTQKSFTADQPGDSSGGSVNITPKSFPEQRTIGITTGVGFNDRAQNSTYPSYSSGGDWDLIALGHKSRTTATERSTAVPFLTRPGSAPLYYKFGANYGESFPIGSQRLGLVFGVLRDSTGKLSEGYEVQRSGRLPNPSRKEPGDMVQGKLSLRNNDWNYVQAVEETSVSGILGVSYQFSPEHEISYNTFLTQVGIDTTKYQEEPGMIDQRVRRQIRERHSLYYKERNLTSHQLKGTHLFPDFGELKMDWNLGTSSTYQDEPDFRKTTYIYNTDNEAYELDEVFLGTPVNILNRNWRKVEETLDSGLLNFTIPGIFKMGPDASLKFGGSISAAERTFTESFYFGNPNELVSFQSPEELETLIQKNSFAYLNTPTFSEADAERTLKAGYLMFTLPLFPKFELNLGGRFESTDITVTSPNNRYENLTFADYASNPVVRDVLGITKASSNGVLKQEDWLPGINATYKLTSDMNLRAGFSRTVARPSFRELGPYFIDDLDSGDLMVGNPQLQMSDITSYDLRWEWFIKANSLVAVSYFQKDIARPIEQFYASLGSNLIRTWFNNPNTAHLKGIEVEARTGLDVIADWLEPLSVGGNFTYIDASVALAPGERRVKSRGYGGLDKTPESRRLFDQPEWIVNVDMTASIATWGTDLTFALNSTSNSLIAAGNEYSFDTYKDKRMKLDFILSQKLTDHLSLRFAAKNILDPEIKWIYDPEETNGELLRKSYHEGRNYSLSVAYEF